MRAFVADLGLKGVRILRVLIKPDDGRYTYRLRLGERKTTVDMPGIPLAEVRFTNHGDNPWHFPRLYVDGSSWLWCWALSSAGADLTGDEDWEAPDGWWKKPVEVPK